MTDDERTGSIAHIARLCARFAKIVIYHARQHS